MRQQRLRLVPIVRKARRPDTDSALFLAANFAARHPHHPVELPHTVLQLIWSRSRQQHHKFVAAHSRDVIRTPAVLLQHQRHAL